MGLLHDPPTSLNALLDLLPETQFNVELVVQCVRVSNNPQTHNHALLLLGSAATVFPVSGVCVSVCVWVWVGVGVCVCVCVGVCGG